MNNQYLNDNIRTLELLNNLEFVYKKILDEIIYCFKNGHMLIFMGNGGSAVDVAHIAADFMINKNGIKMRAISLTDNLAYFSSIANDYSYDDIFRKQIEVLAEEGDIVFGITTSGKATNVLNGLKYSKENDIKTVLVTGEHFNYDCDYIVNIPNTNTTIIQNMYMILFHMLMLDVEKYYNEHRN
ncbi:MAG: SIS domain-containing protein [Bacilli bacterium]